jgi:transposase
MEAYNKQLELLQSIPGVGKEGAKGILSEIGTDMDVFPDEQHLSSWAGICPGNNESAGKKKFKDQTREQILKNIIDRTGMGSNPDKRDLFQG